MGFIITVDTEGLEPGVYEEMLKRFNNWKPIKARMKLVFESHMRQQLNAQPIGDMKRLGPSILGGKGQFISVGKKKFTAGTRVSHAPYYNAWRKKKGMPDILNATDSLIADIADVILVWTFDGEGYTKHKIPRKRRRK